MDQDQIEGFRLSPQQRHLWRLGAGRPAAPYRARCVITVRETYDPAALRGALEDVAARHEILRTRFPRMANVRLPLQVLAPSLPEVVTEADSGRLQTLLEEEWLQPLDCESGPPLRARLVEDPDGSLRLVLTLSALCADGPSLCGLFREIALAYAARVGALEEGAAEPVQYADVSEWENDLLQADDAAAGRDHWRRPELASPGELRLPAERRRPAPFAPQVRRLAFPPELSRRVEELAGAWEIAPGDLLLAAWRALLWRLTGAPGLVVGLVLDGRKYADLAGVLGPLARHLPVAGELRGELGFQELAQQTREMAEEARLWQEHFAWDGAGEGRDEAAEPFLPFGFELAEAVEPLALAGARFELGSERAVVDRFRAHLRCERGGEGWTAELSYDASALDSTDAERLLEELLTLLAGAAERPAGPLAELEVVGARERELILAGFNRSAVVHPRPDRLLHELFEEQVDRGPEAEAVLFEDGSLSYGALERRANQLAHALRRCGVGPDVPVAIVAERSLEMVVGLLGVLKAGGCYVPVDPEYPAERMAGMLEDAAPAVVLTQARLAAALPRRAGRVLRLDADWPVIAAERDARPQRVAGPESLAYILFTSGSTGRPKGVMIPHRAVVNHLLWMGSRVPLGPGDRVVQKTPLSFDPSIWELCAPLQSGACLVMARPGAHRDSASLVELMARQQVTVLRVVPTLLRMLLDEPGLERCTALRDVCCGGEALPPDLRDRFFQRLGAGLHNVYGPTEATIVSTAWTCREGEEGVPIGLPIANSRVYILDAKLSPVPLGVPGELWIGGINVGRGYVGRPELTAERYLPDPFSDRPGSRLYRSGDLARFRPDGAVEFLGRVDHQVKLHGVRIELPEIEAALQRHSAVALAIVLLREDTPGDPRLVAYWVAMPGEDATPSVLRAHLQELLPAAMLPAFFVRLAELPLAPNGKVDRHALPAPEAAPDRTGEYAMPRTPEEEVLAAIWAEVVGVEQVGIHDNFFALGADSIRALRVVALAREKGIEISLAALFEHQTIAALSRELQRSQAGGDEIAPSAPFSLITPEDRGKLPAGVEDAYPMTSMQLGMIFHMQMHPDAPSYHNVNCFLLQAELSEPCFREAVRRVVARHPILRTSFDLDTYSEPMQLVHEQAHFPIEVEDLSALPPAEQERVVDALLERERQRLFDLARPPQMRYFIHRLDERTFWLTHADNHAILDGWSLTSILREVMTLHNALLHGLPLPEEPPLKTTYRDFVRLERAALESEECRSFWVEKVRGAEPVTLPRWPSVVDRKSPLRVRLLPVELPDATIDGLRRLARRAAVPMKSVCLAAHCKAMSLISGVDDLLTGLPTHGRPETVDGERVRGLFLNTVPFRLRLCRETWLDLIGRVFQAERELMPYRRYPLAAIQRACPDGPLFEALFSFVEFHHLSSLLDTGELRVLEKYKAWAASHYPLMCGFNQHPPLGRLSMRLYYDTSELADEQVAAYGQCYRTILDTMAAHPEALHTDLEVGGLRDEELALLQGAIHVPELEEEFSF